MVAEQPCNHSIFWKRSDFQKIGDEEFLFFFARVKFIPHLVLAIKAEKMLKKRSCKDLLYIFPIAILDTIEYNIGLAVLEPSMDF